MSGALARATATTPAQPGTATAQPGTTTTQPGTTKTQPGTTTAQSGTTTTQPGTTTAQPSTTVLSSITLRPATGHARAQTHGSEQVSGAAIAIAAVAVVALLATAAWAWARSRAYEPKWLLGVRHAMAEAGYRTSATWAEFVDWVRLGR